MQTNRRDFIKRMNRALAGAIGVLGFGSCGKEVFEETFTVKGKVTNKVTKEPIKEIRVGFEHDPEFWATTAYGVTPTPFKPKANVTTNAEGEFILIDRFSEEEIRMNIDSLTLPVYVSDNKSRLFQPKLVQVEFSKNTSKGYEANIDVELTEIGQ